MKNKMNLFQATLAATVATGAIVVTIPSAVEAASFQVNDLAEDSYHYDDIHNLLEREIVKGFQDSTYRPHAPVTRGQVASILANVLEVDLENIKEPGFSDVATTNRFYAPIAALTEKGILTGFSDGTFGPNETLTRAQMAKMLVLAFNLDVDWKFGKEHGFTDLDQEDKLSDYIQTLVNYDITKGVTATTYHPNRVVTRGQLASFIARSEKAIAASSVSGEIQEITGNTLVLSTGIYSIPASLKGIFNTKNMRALSGAVVELETEAKVLQSIQSLALVGNGRQYTNMLFDGEDSEIVGDFTVNGNFVTVKNVTVKGDLTIFSNAVNGFFADNVVVKGETMIARREDTQESRDDAGGTITFTNTRLEDVIVSQQEATIDFKGRSTIENITLNTDAILKADRRLWIPTALLNEGVKRFTTQVPLDHLIVGTKEATTIDGTGSIDLLKIDTTEEVRLLSEGEIDIIEANLVNTKLSLGEQTKVNHIKIPSKASLSDIIQNFDQVSANIAQVEGGTNVQGESSNDQQSKGENEKN